MPDPIRLAASVRQAAWACLKTPGRRGKFIALQNVTDVLVAGDLHGNVANFRRILEIANLQSHPQRHLVLQEMIHGPANYAEGGDQSHQLVDLFATLKCQYPERVHYLLGNHELSQWTQRAVIKNGVDYNVTFKQGLTTAYGDAAEGIYGAYETLFCALPVILRLPNGVILSHSMPGGSRLPHWELHQMFSERMGEEAYKLGGSVHAVVWGRDSSEQTVTTYLEKTEGTCLCSGHVPCEDGFQIPNTRQLILDCKDERACCCLIPAVEAVSSPELQRGLVRLHDTSRD